MSASGIAVFDTVDAALAKSSILTALVEAEALLVEAELFHYGYLAIVAGIVIEADATLLTAAFLAHRGYFRLSAVLLIAAAGTILASQLYYLIARRSGMTWLNQQRNTRLEKIVAWSKSHGELLLLASRFMSGFRTLIPVVCGATGMSPWRFVIWNSLGAVIWAAIFGLAGYFGGHFLTILFDDIRHHEKTIAICLAVIVAATVLWRTHGRELSEAWSLRRAR